MFILLTSNCFNYYIFYRYLETRCHFLCGVFHSSAKYFELVMHLFQVLQGELPNLTIWCQLCCIHTLFTSFPITFYDRQFPRRLRHLANVRLRVAFHPGSLNHHIPITCPLQFPNWWFIFNNMYFSRKNKLSTFPIQIILSISNSKKIILNHSNIKAVLNKRQPANNKTYSLRCHINRDCLGVGYQAVSDN